MQIRRFGGQKVFYFFVIFSVVTVFLARFLIKDLLAKSVLKKRSTYTFNHDILPVFKKHCTKCHYEFKHYKNVKRYLAKIKQKALVEKSMPPSYATVGALSKSERKMIAVWIEEGAPEKSGNNTGNPPVVTPTPIKDIVKNCSLCHGKDGISKSKAIPNLKGQSYRYLVAQLIAYQSGKRKSAMTNYVKGLTQEEMKEVARYFAVLAPEPIAPPLDKVKDPEVKKKLTEGKCMECHGWNRASRYAGVPYLAGQNSGYLKKQLKAFFISEDKDKFRIHPMHPMMALAKQKTGKWSEQDVEKIARFFSELYTPKKIAKPHKKDRPFIPDPEDSSRNLFRGCMMCHRKNGMRRHKDSETANLAGQDRQYFMNQLMAFKKGTRKGESMDGQLESISEGHFKTMVNYFSDLNYWKRPKAPGLVSERGCASCHGESGVGVDKSIPHLAGQKASYLIQRMKDFQKPSSHVMYFALKDLTEEQLKAIADYYSAFKVDGTLKKASSK